MDRPSNQHSQVEAAEIYTSLSVFCSTQRNVELRSMVGSGLSASEPRTSILRAFGQRPGLMSGLSRFPGQVPRRSYN